MTLVNADTGEVVAHSLAENEAVIEVRVRCPLCGRTAETIEPLQPGRWVHYDPTNGTLCGSTVEVLDTDRSDR